MERVVTQMMSSRKGNDSSVRDKKPTNMLTIAKNAMMNIAKWVMANLDAAAEAAKAKVAAAMKIQKTHRGKRINSVKRPSNVVAGRVPMSATQRLPRGMRPAKAAAKNIVANEVSGRKTKRKKSKHKKSKHKKSKRTRSKHRKSKHKKSKHRKSKRTRSKHIKSKINRSKSKTRKNIRRS